MPYWLAQCVTGVRHSVAMSNKIDPRREGVAYTLAVRVPEDLRDALDAYVQRHRNDRPGVRFERSDAVREILYRALRQEAPQAAPAQRPTGPRATPKASAPPEPPPGPAQPSPGARAAVVPADVIARLKRAQQSEASKPARHRTFANTRVCKAAGVQESAVRKYLAGKITPSLDAARDIAAFLDKHGAPA
jgi:hypothetical protein